MSKKLEKGNETINNTNPVNKNNKNLPHVYILSYILYPDSSS